MCLLTSEVDSRRSDEDGEDHGEADPDEPPPLRAARTHAAAATAGLPDPQRGVRPRGGGGPREQSLLGLPAHVLKENPKIRSVSRLPISLQLSQSFTN